MLTAVLVILPGIRPDIVHLLGSTFRIGIPVAGMIITGLALESAGLPKPAPGLASMLMTILACGLVTLALAWLVNAGNIRDIWHARGFPPLPRRDA